VASEIEFVFANYDGGLPFYPIPEVSGVLVLKPAGIWELHYSGRLNRPTAKTVFRLSDYDGASRFHRKPEPSGTFVLTPDARWELHFEGSSRWIHGGTGRFQFEAIPSGPSSCHVRLRDPEDPEAGAEFDLHDTSVTEFQTAVTRHLPDRWVFDGIQRYPMRVTKTGPSSCHVTVQDVQLPTVHAEFDLPETSVEAFQEGLRTQIVAPPLSPQTTAKASRNPSAPQQSASERYFEQKLRSRQHWRAARMVGTTACCGIPCLVVALVLVAVVASAVALA
jgi:hypothetical protein